MFEPGLARFSVDRIGGGEIGKLWNNTSVFFLCGGRYKIGVGYNCCGVGKHVRNGQDRLDK